MPKKDESKSLSYWLSEQINLGILQGTYPSGSLLESERDLCKKYGVSRTTVRAAVDILSDRRIVEKHSGRGVVVLNAQLPDGSKAVNFEQGRITIVYVRLVAAMVSVEMYLGVKNYCEQNNLELIALDAQLSHERLINYLTYRPEKTSGVVLRPYNTKEYAVVLNELMEQNIEVVCMQRSVDGANVSTVCDDEFTGFYSAVSELVKRTQKGVYMLNFKPDSAYSEDNSQKGWRTALGEYGIENWQDYLYQIDKTEYEQCACTLDNHYQSSKKKALELFKKIKISNMPINLITRNDHFARGVYMAAEDMGIKIGKDVYLISYGDYPIARVLNPQLSCIHSSPISWGHHAMKLLHERIRGKKGANKALLIPTQLVERESSWLSNKKH